MLELKSFWKEKNSGQGLAVNQADMAIGVGITTNSLRKTF